MQPLSDDMLSFASSNKHKYDEARSITTRRGIHITHVKTKLLEIQSENIGIIAKEKARSAFSKIRRPVLVEDDGLFIDALGGFPGPYASYVLKTIGISGILKLLENHSSRRATFVAAIAYADGTGTPEVFESAVSGSITVDLRGDGWGYDPVFLPGLSDKTFAEMTASEKERKSHRAGALGMFCNWYKELPA